jgi:acetylglutamate kinase
MTSIVVKVGGEVVASGEAALLARDIVALADGGARVTVVHGGGPQATALQKQLGIETKQIAGRRFTDAATLDVMKMAIAGKVNVDLCAALSAGGVKAVGVHGASTLAVRAVKRPPKVYQGGGPEPVDLGHVGDVVGFNQELLDALAAKHFVPVIACIGADEAGNVYNINADAVANQLAAAIGDGLFMVTSTPGVLRDVNDPTSRLAKLTIAEAKQAIADHVVTGGMIAKLEEAIEVVVAGVGQVTILGKLAAGDLVRAVREPGAVGTTLVA